MRDHRNLIVLTLIGAGLTPMYGATPPVCKVENTVHTEVVAIEHAFQYNRFGAFNPAGMIFALRHDVVPATLNPSQENEYLNQSAEDRWNVKLEPGKVRLRSDKRPRPLVLRINEGECLHVWSTGSTTSPAPRRTMAPLWGGIRVP